MNRSKTRPSPSAGNSSRAAPAAAWRLEPGRATIPGSTPSRNTATALRSVVNGTKGYASPAKTTTAMRLPSSSGRRWVRVSMLRASREGRMSGHRIESDTSSATTRSRVRTDSSAGDSPHWGRASARTMSVAATAHERSRIRPVAGVPPSKRSHTPGEASRR
ncbi:MAG: hypothetical protein P8Y93_06490 [Acidobacteriota bacterium]